MTDHLKSFKELQRLQSNAEKASTFWEKYEEVTSRAQIDKYRAGFGVDGRNPSFAVKTLFSSYTGTYGNSSVHRFDSFDRELLEKYMVLAMNELSKDLFSKAGELMRKDAEKLLEKARAEVSAMQAALDEVEAQS